MPIARRAVSIPRERYVALGDVVHLMREETVPVPYTEAAHFMREETVPVPHTEAAHLMRETTVA